MRLPSSSPRGLCLAAIVVLASACGRSGPDAPLAPPVGVDRAPPASPWLAAVTASIRASERQPIPRGGGFHIQGARRQLVAVVDAEGAHVVPRGDGTEDAPPVSLRTARVGRGGSLDPADPPLPATSLRAPSLSSPTLGDCLPGGDRDVHGGCLRGVQRSSDGLRAWWGSRGDGLEQGWTLDRRPGGHGPLRFEVEVVGAVARPASEGEALLVAPWGRLRYHGLAAWDADDRPLPTRLEVLDDGLAIVVDDDGASYPVVVDPYLSAVEGWFVSSGQFGAQLGYRVSDAGDVDGDGFDDVLVAAPLYAAPTSGEGRVFLFPGSAAGPSLTAAWTAESDQHSARMGDAIASAGDVNNDGYGDVIVAAPFWDEGLNGIGKVYVFLGSAAGLEAAPAWTAQGDIQSAGLGSAVSSAGDVNGDGFDDVLVGAPSRHGGTPFEGAAYVYFGSASGPGATAGWQWISGQQASFVGSAVAGGGDLDGDGFDDIVVGSAQWDAAVPNQGAAIVFAGSASGPATSPTAIILGEQEDAQFASSIAVAGDCNGDGFDDLAVGEYRWDGAGPDEGRTHVYLGSAGGVSTTADWTVGLGAGSSYIGFAVDWVGDADGDGFDDLVVGAPAFNGPGGESGGAWLFRGSAAGPEAEAAWAGLGPVGSHWYGHSVAGAGDVDGDGFDDVVVGASEYDDVYLQEGGAWIYYGFDDGLQPTPGWWTESDRDHGDLGIAVASAGDVNGDGFDDIVVGDLGYSAGENDEGAAFLYLGSTDGPPDVADWVYESNQVGAWLGASVAGAGDVDGDGFDDVVVGGYRWSDGEANEGGAWAFLGSASGLQAQPSWQTESDQAGAQEGFAVAGAGDVNADGFDDVLIGAFSWSGGEAGEGRVQVFHGSSAGLTATPAWTAESDVDGAAFGIAVAGAGDVNADGFDDVVIGAYHLENGEPNEGRAYVYEGSIGGLAAAPAWTYESDQEGARLGRSVAGAGDVDGDGFDDVVVGAYLYDDGEVDEGAAFLFLGSASGPSAAPDWITTSNQADAGLGLCVAGAGDVDGDGFDDVVVGAYRYSALEVNEGRASLFPGSASGLPPAPSWVATAGGEGAFFGWDCAGAGDVNGDGFDDVLVGAPGLTSGQPSEGGVYLFYGDGTIVDSDGDGTEDDSDCAPEDPSIHPAAPELCDDLDSDCDGDLVDGELDTDGDLVPDCVDDDDDGDGDPDVTDCAPLDDAIHAAAQESCDTVDSDCDGDLVDTFDDLDGDGVPDCTDDDDDGDGDPDDTDCAPLDDTIHAAAQEGCDTIDSDCDGDLVDAYLDFDGDGMPDCTDDDDDDDGDPDGTDCAPLDPSRHAGALESCDAIDSDCDGSLVDGEPDSDFDGEPDCIDSDDDGDGDPDDTDCAPLDPSRHAGALESCDAIDSDCDGDLADGYDDTDGDGEPDCIDDDDDGDGDPDADDCEPLDASAAHGLPEVCDELGLDNDCDPATDDEQDIDGDGVSLCGGDCADADPTVYPGAEEQCDGLDNDCDPATVEDERDLDADGWRVCDGDCDDTDAETRPGAPELCDDLDNDCDGLAEGPDDVDFVDWFFDGDLDGFGDAAVPHPDNPLCDQPAGYVSSSADCDDEDPTVSPGEEERCNGEDDDCFPSTDLDGTDVDADGDGVLACAGDCDDADASAAPGAVEDCDDRADQDCDGTEVLNGRDPECEEEPVDEGCGCAASGTPSGSAGVGWLLLALLLGRRSPLPRRRSGRLHRHPEVLGLSRAEHPRSLVVARRGLRARRRRTSPGLPPAGRQGGGRVGGGAEHGAGRPAPARAQGPARPR